MKKHHPNRNLTAYVGFLDHRPHVQLQQGRGGARVIAVYLSAAAAKCAYSDVRKARLVFDAESREANHE